MPLSLEEESIKAAAIDVVGAHTGDEIAEFLISRALELHAVPERPAWIPSRLVDVSQSFGGKVRVRTSEEIRTRRERTQYVALSHCWGKKWILTYRSNTKSELETGIEVWKLTKTFREAIEITRRLGFNFIWIDSLCILQDDYDDWEREGSDMAKVHRYAAFTIAAVASRDGEGGLFRDTSPLALAKCPLTTYTYERTTSYSRKGKRNTERQEMRIYAKSLPENTYDDVKFDDILQSTWNRRDWTLQERILSKKIVYFGNKGLYFEERERHSGLSLINIHFQTEYPITLSHGERLINRPDPFERFKKPEKPDNRLPRWKAWRKRKSDCTMEPLS